jgi:hypothetical protein
MKHVRLAFVVSLFVGLHADAASVPNHCKPSAWSMSLGLYGGGALDMRSVDAQITENNNGVLKSANKGTKNKPASLLGGVFIEAGMTRPQGLYVGGLGFYEYQQPKSDAKVDFDNVLSVQKYSLKYSTKMEHTLGGAIRLGWWASPSMMPFALIGGGVQFLKTQQQLDAPNADPPAEKTQKKDFKKNTPFLRLGLGAMYQWSPRFQLVGQLTTDMYKKLNTASRDKIDIDAGNIVSVSDKATLKSGMIWKLSVGVRFTFGDTSATHTKS